MLGQDKLNTLFEKLVHVEAEHWRNYWRSREAVRQETDITRLNNFAKNAELEQASAEATHFASNLLADAMDKAGCWSGSRAQESYTALNKWRKEQYNKFNGEERQDESK